MFENYYKFKFNEAADVYKILKFKLTDDHYQVN